MLGPGLVPPPTEPGRPEARICDSSLQVGVHLQKCWGGRRIPPRHRAPVGCEMGVECPDPWAKSCVSSARFDYGDRFWDIKSKYFTCQCGSEKCKHSAEAIALEQSRLARLDPHPELLPDLSSLPPINT